MTVSWAINNPELLKPETLRQVQHAIDALNYVPDLSARKIRGKNTNLSCMGVLAIDTASAPFSVEILLAIEQCAGKYGWDHFVVNISSGLRRDAVQNAWLNAGLSAGQLNQHNITLSDIYYRDIVTLIDQYIDGNSPLFDCIICGNDQIAFVVYQVLLTRGISVPEQAGILGCENMTGTGELFYPPLTTIRSPYRLLGETAALHLIEERVSSGRTYVPCRMLSRDSL